MIDFRGDQSALKIGEDRQIQLLGLGVIKYRLRVFLNSPNPRGFDLALDHEYRSVASGDTVNLYADQGYWSGKEGQIMLMMSDDQSKGGVTFEVESDAQPR